MNHLQTSHTDMLTMLETLVNTDSGSDDKSGVDKVGSMLKTWYEELGFDVETVTQETTGNHLVLRHQETRDPEILILAHMDTVFPKGTADERPFTVKGNYAYGPGVIDMKASHVMLYTALKELIHTNDESYKNVELVFNSDEEIGTETSKALIQTKARGKKAVLVLEPARVDGSIVSSRRGVGQYQLTVTGTAAHAGIEPEKGHSAIEELAHKILKLHELSDPEADLNVNVGLIDGGTSVNTVAPTAQAKIDVRISKQEQGETIDEAIRSICSQTDVEGTHIQLTGGINRPPMMFTDDIQKLVDTVKTEADKLNLNVNHVATGGGSDASFTAAMNIPTLDGLGPVGGKQHSKDEYLEVDSLPERTTLFANVLSRLNR